MKKGLTVTFLAGPSSSFRKGSLPELPIVKLPPGRATILKETPVPGRVSVKLSRVLTCAGSVNTSLPAVASLPNPTFLSCFRSGS